MPRLFPLLLALPVLAWAPEAPEPGLPAELAQEGWIKLFDGQSTAGWSSTAATVTAGVLMLRGTDAGTTLTTTCRFGALELLAEYRFEGGAGTFRLRHGHRQTVVSEAGGDDWQELQFNQPEGTAAAPLEFAVQPGTRLALRSVRLKPLGLKPIFNGKDLTGWREVKTERSRSKFTVTDDGALRVQDGPGDLQTQEQWADFVLQLDVYSNGDALNSGVFCRCVPAGFWSGYEAQIRNEWLTDVTLTDGTELRGKLRELSAGKFEVKLASVENGRVKMGSQTRVLEQAQIKSRQPRRELPVDFGTGGIYFHAPSRRVVSSDREWFTMTVAAHGDHLSVWVNGFLTAEWDDKRPDHSSARQGKKLTAGPISLQGHDPTTDLRFRNLRVGALNVAR